MIMCETYKSHCSLLFNVLIMPLPACQYGDLDRWHLNIVKLSAHAIVSHCKHAHITVQQLCR